MLIVGLEGADSEGAEGAFRKVGNDGGTVLLIISVSVIGVSILSLLISL